uniref:Thymus-specific serine protease n=1 Tax=Neogobius melanostomus TaxID=47308 RepID=A0A8C6WY12_9GOBI
MGEKDNFSHNGQGHCLDVSHEAAVKELMDTTCERGGQRQWLYQTCAELLVSVLWDANPQRVHQTLLRAVRMSQDALLQHIAFTNAYYGADHPGTSRVLYVNGGVDPWHTLSVIRDGTGERGETVFIMDTAHCADMSNQRSSDRRSLREARQEIGRRVSSWLKMAALNST